MHENVCSGFATLDKKLYRLMIAHLDGDHIEDASYCSRIFDLAERGICGFIVSGGTKDDLKTFLTQLRGKGLFIASEMAYGPMSRIKGFAEFPSFMAFAAAADDKDPERSSLFKKVWTAMALDLMECGINMLVIPLLPSGCKGDSPYALVRSECVRTLEDAGLLVYEKNLLSDGTASYRPACGVRSRTGEGSALASGESGTGREPALYLCNGADALVDSEGADAVVQELSRAMDGQVITEEQVDRALAGIEAVKARIGEPREIEVDHVSSEFLSREISQMAVTLVKGKGRFFPLRESDNIPLIYAGDKEYFRTSPLRFYVKQASHISRPLPSKERPAMLLLFGNAAADGLPSGAGADEMESLLRLIRATSPSVVVSFGSPYALIRFREADFLIAAYDPTAHAQEAVFKCVTGERGFRGRLPVRLDISDRKGGWES